MDELHQIYNVQMKIDPTNSIANDWLAQ